MFVTHGTDQDLENAKVVLAMIALVIVVFWKLLLRVLIAIIVIVVVVTAGAGAIVLFQGMHR
jgi:MFS superfamily sulfate permease-like transporter